MTDPPVAAGSRSTDIYLWASRIRYSVDSKSVLTRTVESTAVSRVFASGHSSDYGALLMNIRLAICLSGAVAGCSMLGCSSDTPTVIQPTETYQLTEQEQQNRARANTANEEQRQQ